MTEKMKLGDKMRTVPLNQKRDEGIHLVEREYIVSLKVRVWEPSVESTDFPTLDWNMLLNVNGYDAGDFTDIEQISGFFIGQRTDLRDLVLTADETKALCQILNAEMFSRDGGGRLVDSYNYMDVDRNFAHNAVNRYVLYENRQIREGSELQDGDLVLVDRVAKKLRTSRIKGKPADQVL